MNYLLLAICVLLFGVQSLLHKQYAVKSHDPLSVYVFNLFGCGASTLTLAAVILISGVPFQVHIPTVICGTIFGLGFIGATTALNISIESGSMSLTNLIMNFSVVMPTIWSVCFLGERFQLMTGIGFVLLVLSLWMFNYKNETLEVNRKWLIWVTVLFITNGGCAVLMKMHQVWYPGQYRNEYMFIGFAVTTVFNFFYVLLNKNKKKKKNAIKQSVLFAVPEGIGNALTNLIVMILAVLIPSTIEYPVVSAGSIVCAFIWAVFIYREKMTKLQTVGFLVAVASIIVLNL